MTKTRPTKATDTLSKQRLRLWLRILKVSRMIESELRDNLRVDHATTLPRFDVLAALYRYEKGLRMSDLSSVLKVSNGNVTGIVDRLAEAGHLIRVPVAHDRRATMVRLTRKGREHFTELAGHHENWINRLLQSAKADDTRDLIRLLDGIADEFDATAH